MLAKQVIGFCLVGCLSGGAPLVAQAQTGRIVHFSHGGSVATLALFIKADDNLGTPQRKVTEWKRDSLVYLNDSTIVHAGLMRTGYRFSTEKEGWHQAKENFIYYHHAEIRIGLSMVEYLKYHYPNAIFIGFGKKAHKSKIIPQEPASRSQTFLKRPFQYSYWREISSIVAVGAVGWLLGKKQPAA